MEVKNSVGGVSGQLHVENSFFSHHVRDLGLDQREPEQVPASGLL